LQDIELARLRQVAGSYFTTRPGQSLKPGCLPFVRRWLNDFPVRTPRSPVAHFPQGGSKQLPVAFVCCGPVRRLEKVECGLDCCKLGFGYEIAVRRYRPVRKFGRLVSASLTNARLTP
jgi:hypothetical protein